MSSSARKLLEDMRNSKSGWKLKDLLSAYLGFGFTIRHGRRHDVLKHPDFPELRTTLPRHAKELAKKYVSTAIQLIDRLLELQKEANRDAGSAKRKS